MNWLVDKSIKDIQLFYQDCTWHHKNAFSYLDDLCNLAWTKEDLNIVVVGFVSNKVMTLLQKRTKFFCEIIFDSQGQCNRELVLLFPSYTCIRWDVGRMKKSFAKMTYVGSLRNLWVFVRNFYPWASLHLCFLGLKCQNFWHGLSFCALNKFSSWNLDPIVCFW